MRKGSRTCCEHRKHAKCLSVMFREDAGTVPQTMKADMLRHWLCDASGASQPAGIVKELGRNSSAHFVRFTRFGDVSFVVSITEQ